MTGTDAFVLPNPSHPDSPNKDDLLVRHPELEVIFQSDSSEDDEDEEGDNADIDNDADDASDSEHVEDEEDESDEDDEDDEDDLWLNLKRTMVKSTDDYEEDEDEEIVA
jgi:hypothetical protein